MNEKDFKFDFVSTASTQPSVVEPVLKDIYVETDVLNKTVKQVETFVQTSSLELSQINFTSITPWVAFKLHLLAFDAFKQDDFNRSFFYASISAEASRLLGQNDVLAHSVFIMGNIKLILSDYDAAIKYYESSLSFLEPQYHDTRSIAYLNLGSMYILNKNQEKASINLLKFLVSASTENADSLRTKAVNLLMHATSKNDPVGIISLQEILRTIDPSIPPIDRSKLSLNIRMAVSARLRYLGYFALAKLFERQCSDSSTAATSLPTVASNSECIQNET